ncbi:ammonium transporter [Echinicola jeungdonensis]|uniref:Ammonium transporter n=1 Tax=Echinicola jeungdonensis TaxID=709343 RepID=A0ABV5J6I8_9BACT|nr:ammonium transporter [Echinicola jeungdonensis]MDN3669315.1 ammonium transporter [Echinicola jeungdonensis]
MNQEIFTINNVWMMVATILVFIMHLGFAALECGLTRAKNTINILFKNTIIPALGLLTYAFIGFNLMYPGDVFSGGFLGLSGLGLSLPEGWDTSAYSEGYTFFTDFIFQAMFAATAATIVSGAVAERIKLGPFLFFSLIYVGICYPIVGMWKWGGGFLDTLSTPFYDFAGSTIVHSVGGWGALVGAYLLGPRIGKFTERGMNAIPGHNIPMAVIGVFLLWFGWFGFNGGSVLSADPGTVSLVFVTTSIAGAAGAFGALIASYLKFKSYDITMVLNGILAGLVGITAGADQMAVWESAVIGLIGGALVVFAVVFFDRLKVDDPVGAISVHLVGGIWGTLAVGIFGDLASFSQFISQLIGVAAVGVFCLVSSWILFYGMKKTVGIRVHEQEEVEGLDISEHSMRAYPDFATKE